MDRSLPGSSVHGIFQAQILEWVPISFSRESSWPKESNPHILSLAIVGGFVICWVIREALVISFVYSSMYMLIPSFQKYFKAKWPLFYLDTRTWHVHHMVNTLVLALSIRSSLYNTYISMNEHCRKQNIMPSVMHV